MEHKTNYSSEHRMKADLKIIKLTGKQILPYIKDLANLRIQLLREYPYLYDGDMEYEEEYLQPYLKSEKSKVMLVMDNEKIVGATTAIPLKDEVLDIREPFLQNNENINKIFYLGESLLLPEYRGQGTYKEFFRFREEVAKEQGYTKTAFMSVVRPADHPCKPKKYQSLEPIWQHFGYHCVPNLLVFFPWKEIGESAQSKKPLMIWMKNL